MEGYSILIGTASTYATFSEGQNNNNIDEQEHGGGREAFAAPLIAMAHGLSRERTQQGSLYKAVFSRAVSRYKAVKIARRDWGIALIVWK